MERMLADITALARIALSMTTIAIRETTTRTPGVLVQKVIVRHTLVTKAITQADIKLKHPGWGALY